MAGTRLLDWVTSYARDRGAIVRLLGDPAQLNSVEAGGMLSLLAHDTGAAQLTDLHRFTDPDEAAATLAIREGRPEAVDFYQRHDRITTGSSDAILEAAYDAWATDTANGRTSLLITSSNRDATNLNTRARRTRITAGFVEADGVDLHDGTAAGTGDRIVTRRNDRRLTTRDGNRFVKNGDTWTVITRHTNGDLTIADLHGSHVRVPHHYVARDVELAYATTTARAQGRTVDTTHALIDHTTDRAALYVAATRAREHTQLYIPDTDLLTIDAERPPAPVLDAVDHLTATITKDTDERAATEVRRLEQTAVARTSTPKPHRDVLPPSHARPGQPAPTSLSI
jgi:ATP-dependent exoDNAse (exonuclease V) alpha subunit